MGQLPENMLQHFVSSFKLESQSFSIIYAFLKALFKIKNIHTLQYFYQNWLLLPRNMIHQLLKTVLYAIPRKVRFTKRCFQKISGVLYPINIEKLLTKVFHFCFLVFIFLLLVLPFIADASMCFFNPLMPGGNKKVTHT